MYFYNFLSVINKYVHPIDKVDKKECTKKILFQQSVQLDHSWVFYAHGDNWVSKNDGSATLVSQKLISDLVVSRPFYVIVYTLFLPSNML